MKNKTAQKRPRDYQRSKVYWTQGIVFLKINDFFNDIEEADECVNSILSKKWFQKAFGRIRRVRCIRTKSTHWNWAKKETNTIGLSSTGMRQFVVLHELAHLCTPSKYSPHGGKFCSNLLFLVKMEMGDAMYWELKNSFNKYKVNYKIFRRTKNGDKI